MDLWLIATAWWVLGDLPNQKPKVPGVMHARGKWARERIPAPIRLRGFLF